MKRRSFLYKVLKVAAILPFGGLFISTAEGSVKVEQNTDNEWIPLKFRSKGKNCFYTELSLDRAMSLIKQLSNQVHNGTLRSYSIVRNGEIFTIDWEPFTMASYVKIEMGAEGRFANGIYYLKENENENLALSV